MDVKLNINLNSNLMNLGKSGSAVAGGANLSAGTLNLKSGDSAQEIAASGANFSSRTRYFASLNLILVLFKLVV